MTSIAPDETFTYCIQSMRFEWELEGQASL